MRRPTLLVVLWATLALLLLAAIAREASAHPTTNPVTLAVSLAETYWSTIPCEGHITVTASGIEPVDPEVGPAASLKGIVGMWTQPSTCTITLNLRLWPTWQLDDERFQWLCDGITHELGHLPPLNHPDAGHTNPESIEYPIIEPGSANYNSVPECQHVTLWYGPFHIRG